MEHIDINTIKLIDSFGYNQTGSIYFRNLATVKSGEHLNCYVVLKGSYLSGKSFKKEFKVSFKSYKQLFEITLDNIKRTKGLKQIARG